MSRELHRVIDRFVNGEMRPVEERDFMSLVELDPELDRLFRAERVVQSTMANDRDALAGVDHSEGYARFLNGLASSVRRTAPRGGAFPAGSGESLGNRAATAAVLAIIVGMCLLAVSHLGGWGDDATPPAPRSIPAGSGAPAPHVPVRERSKGRSTTVREEFSRRDAKSGNNRGGEKAVPHASASAGAAAHESVDSSALRGGTEREELPVFQDDTVRTRLHVRPDDR